MKLKTYTGEEARALRKKAGMNQQEFWQHFQTTQSGGSRYESIREIPAPVQLLLNIAFGTDAKSAAIVAKMRTLAKRPQKKTAGTATPPSRGRKSSTFGVLP